jgi:two-component system, OmpR family, phosphate regulon sensor histidine kinase PhoR
VLSQLPLRAAAVAAGAAIAGLGLGWWARDNHTGGVFLLEAFALAMIGGAVGGIAFLSTGRAIRDVRLTSSRLAEGRMDERVPPRAGSAGELTGSFNRMAQRLQSEVEESHAEHARLVAVLDASDDAMAVLGADLTLRYLNRAGGQLMSADPARAVDRPFIEAVRDYELDALARAAVSASASQTAVITFGPARTPIRAAAMPIAGGAGWDVLLMLTDLTEVTRVDQVRRDFLGNVSHELRTPLASIRALAETLELEADAPGKEAAVFLRRIRLQVDRLTALVNELLDLSRIESGALPLHPEAIPLDELVGESAAFLRQRFEERGITIALPPGDGPSIEGDRPSLLRAVNNLLDNAVKYSPPGTTVHVETRDEGELAAIVVRDEGPGIAPHDIHRVFERFYKGDASRASSGVGLGLAIVKHTVRIHGGTATVESTPGQGAAFTLRLPKIFAGARPPRSHNHG